MNTTLSALPVVDSIDTPALVVDLDAMERNIATMAACCRQHRIAWRPHAKLHKSAELALLLVQVGAGGVFSGALRCGTGPQWQSRSAPAESVLPHALRVRRNWDHSPAGRPGGG